MKHEHRFITIVFVITLLLVLSEASAFAMHISEGILPLPWAILWFAVSGPFLLAGLRELSVRGRHNLHLKPMIGLVGAAVFIISCMPIPVPTAGSCSHPCGTGIAAIFIGPLLTVVVTSVALLLQALFLAHGGLTTLGADLASMGVAGAFAGYGTFILVRRLSGKWWIAAFLAGVLSDWATYAVTSIQLATALHGSASLSKFFLTVLLAFVPTQLPLGILEGFLCVGAYKFILTRRPELLQLFSGQVHL
ncbi:MAG TPA: energy-coupling factor ABC transporter permease [Syntrophobacteraceae bacterium]|nr:energy-coupling factor ABC transporter permease [Syntrophobacteraceae bacterium]